MLKKPKFDPFKNLVLDEYEQEIEDNIDKLDLTPLSPAKMAMLKKAAEKTLKEIKLKKRVKISTFELQKLHIRISKQRLPNLVYLTKP